MTTYSLLSTNFRHLVLTTSVFNTGFKALGTFMKSFGMIMVMLAFSLFASSLSASLIVNGSFEAPVVPVGSFTNFGGGSTAITGWTVVGVDSTVVSGSFSQSGITFQAQNGVQWVDLAGVTSNSMSSGVTQGIATTAGSNYEISFWVGSARAQFFDASTVDLQIDSGPRMHFTNPATPNNMLNWKEFVVSFTATNSTTNITFLNGSASNNFLSALDNVSVNLSAVPEPSSLCLMLGLGMLGLMSGPRHGWRPNL